MSDPFTLQEALDTAYLGVLKQGRPSRGTNTYRSCLYRGPDGLKCAMGFLIDDETAKTHEGEGAALFVDELGWSKELGQLADALQVAHDSAPADDGFLPSFKDSAAEVAKRFGLTVPA